MRQRIPIVPISRNLTVSARERVRMLGLDARWLGVTSKIEALGQVCRPVTVHTTGVFAPEHHEPAAMALIAARTIAKLPSSLPQATGASEAALLGHVHWP